MNWRCRGRTLHTGMREDASINSRPALGRSADLLPLSLSLKHEQISMRSIARARLPAASRLYIGGRLAKPDRAYAYLWHIFIGGVAWTQWEVGHSSREHESRAVYVGSISPQLPFLLQVERHGSSFLLHKPTCQSSPGADMSPADLSCPGV